MATVQNIRGSIPFLKDAHAHPHDNGTGTEQVVRTIKGFASMKGVDRDGDDIDPFLFDVETYMKNPQVFVDHHLWKREDGNEVSVGSVQRMVVARVIESKSADLLDVVDAETGEVVDSIPSDDRRLAKVGDLGLWVVADIVEPGVVPLIDDGRIKAFSWRGQLVKDDMGGERIDLMEVSVVHIGANPNAVFMVEKTLSGVDLYFIAKKSGWRQSMELPSPVAVSPPDKAKHPFVVCMKTCDGEESMTPMEGEDEEEVHRAAAHIFYGNGALNAVAVLKHSGVETEDHEGIYEVSQSLVRKPSDATRWSKAYVEALPDSSFAYVHQQNGVTKRLCPIKDHKGQYNKRAVEVALASLPTHEMRGSLLVSLAKAADAVGLSIDKSIFTKQPASCADDTKQDDSKQKGGGQDMAENNDLQFHDDVVSLGHNVDRLVKGLETLLEVAKHTQSKGAAEGAPAAAPAAAPGTQPPQDQGAKLAETLEKMTNSLTDLSSRLEKLEKATQDPGQVTDDNKEGDDKQKALNLQGEDRNKALDLVMRTFLTSGPSSR